MSSLTGAFGWGLFAIFCLGIAVAGFALRRRRFEEWPLIVHIAIAAAIIRPLIPVIELGNVFHGILFEEPSIWLFMLVTLIMGGGLAFMTGQACAETWRSVPQTIVYLLILGLAVRFVHFALFHGKLLSAHYYIVDTIVVGIIGLLAWRATRARQMATQYWWLYQRTGPFSYRERPSPLSSPP